MRRLVFHSMLISFILALSGCKANYKKISSEPDFSQFIGQAYVLKNDMSMRGINLPPGYSEKIDVYVVDKLYKVQHEAPEEITFAVFPRGNTFTIGGVYECTNCLSFSKLRNVSIITGDFEKAVDVPITMPMHEIVSKENVALVK